MSFADADLKKNAGMQREMCGYPRMGMYWNSR